MNRHGKTLAALATVGGLLLVSCRSDDKESTSTNAPTTTVAAGADTTVADTAVTDTTTADTEASDTTTADTEASDTTTADTEAPAADAWTIDTDNCADPDAANAPIEGDIKIGSAQPLSGTPAVAFAPVKEGMELYFEYANAQGLIPDHTVSVDIRDDQYDPTQTPNVVSSLIDENVALFSGIIGSPNNLAVRDTLNEECIPQLLALTGSPDWGDIENYPWLTGALVPYDIESKIYAKTMKDLGETTVGLFSVNNDFGKVYADAFKEAAAEQGIEIIEEQTIEPAETTPPTNQLGAIAAAKPDAIMAIPLGAQCPTFTKELVNAKAVAGDWNPIVFQTNTCASRLLISALAAGSADGVYTSSNLVDPSDPKFDSNAGVQTFKEAYAAKGLTGDLGTTATGWSVGEYTVAILIKASESGEISRKSIIEAARNLEFTPSLGREGVDYKLAGEADPFTFQSLQVLQWNEASGTFTEIGTVDTEYESWPVSTSPT